MIVGHGLMARAFSGEFAEDPRVAIFASGVSNSDETKRDAFERERRALADALAHRPGCLVYFSTCSVADAERKRTAYVQHKVQMEEIVAAAGRHVILRLPQVVGDTPNPHTLANYLHSRIASGTPFAVWKNAWRNLIDIEDVVRIGTHMIRDDAYANRRVSIASPVPVRVMDLVRIFERVLGVPAKCDPVDRGDNYPIDIADAMAVAARVGVEFGPEYVEKVIKAYYGNKLARP
jgi:nucleoside-diphosphate-sugar epimerase